MAAHLQIVVPRIAANEIVLRPFESTDADAMLDASGDSAITAVTTVSTDPDPVLATEWIARQHERAVTGSAYSFAIEVGDECVGQIGLWLHEMRHGRATVGYWIRPARRRRGHALAALQVLSTWAWTLPDVHRLQLHIDPTNKASWLTAERAGYEREGLLRSWQEIAGERRDMFVYGSVRPA